MKKCCEFAFAAGLTLLLAACGAQSQAAAEPESTPVPVQEPAQTETTYDSDDLASMLSAMTAETENAAQKAADGLADVQAQWGESYEMYMAHTEAADTFYSQTIEEAQALYARLEAIELDYFRCVSAQGLEDYDTWDDAMEEFYDTWNDAMEDYYDAWNDAYEDVYDLSDDLIGEAADELSYEEYSNLWLEMYDGYSAAWQNMYEAYSDAWSAVYQNYSDVWSGFYNEETDVEEILRQAEIEAAEKEEAATEQAVDEESLEEPADSTDETLTSEPEVPQATAPAENETDVQPAADDSIRPEFQEAMDSYEAFFDEYCDIMQKYNDSDGTDLTILADYASYMAQYAQMMKDFEAWEDEELTTAENLYFIEVQSRINQKLLAVTEG